MSDRAPGEVIKDVYQKWQVSWSTYSRQQPTFISTSLQHVIVSINLMIPVSKMTGTIVSDAHTTLRSYDASPNGRE